MSPHQVLDAPGIVELGPFRALRRDGVVLAPDLHAQLGDALRLPRRLELDLVDVGRREHERDDYADIEDAQDHRRRSGPPRPTTSAGDGKRGRSGADTRAATGAAVRSAARSLAGRARGLARISPSSGTIGRRVSTWKVSPGCATSGR